MSIIIQQSKPVGQQIFYNLNHSFNYYCTGKSIAPTTILQSMSLSPPIFYIQSPVRLFPPISYNQCYCVYQYNPINALVSTNILQSMQVLPKLFHNQYHCFHQYSKTKNTVSFTSSIMGVNATLLLAGDYSWRFIRSIGFRCFLTGSTIHTPF